MKNITESTRQEPTETEVWELRLYVAGQTPRSLEAFEKDYRESLKH